MVIHNRGGKITRARLHKRFIIHLDANSSARRRLFVRFGRPCSTTRTRRGGKLCSPAAYLVATDGKKVGSSLDLSPSLVPLSPTLNLSRRHLFPYHLSNNYPFALDHFFSQADLTIRDDFISHIVHDLHTRIY